MWTQALELEALHTHSRDVETATLPDPPEAPKFDAELVSVTWHLAAVGPVTLVSAELPHAISVGASSIESSRGRHTCTGQQHARCGPVRTVVSTPCAAGTRLRAVSIALLIIGCAGACVSNPVLRAGAASGACADTSAADVQWVRAVAPDERQASARW